MNDIFAAARAGGILVVDEAVGPEVCDRLMAVFHRHASLAPRADGAIDVAVHGFDGRIELASRRLVLDVTRACMRQIGERGTWYTQPFYPETVVLAALGGGASMCLHADNALQDDVGRWVPNHTPHRSLSALLYLNEDFDGGEIAFAEQGVVIKPRPGLMIAFPSSREFPHAVLPVTRGLRCSMPIWFTSDPARAIMLESIDFQGMTQLAAEMRAPDGLDRRSMEAAGRS